MAMRVRREPLLLSWSGGKDCALTLARLREDPAYEVVGLLTTVTARFDRISVHGVRRTLLHRQARALRLPLHEVVVELQWSNQPRDGAASEPLASLPAHLADVRCIAFGDIFRRDVREFREVTAQRLGFSAIFPLWGESTRSVANDVISRRFTARVVCVDTHVLPASFAGRSFGPEFLHALPPGVDPCGEYSEFHTFVSGGPGFHERVVHDVVVARWRDDRFAYCDLTPPVEPIHTRRSLQRDRREMFMAQD